MTPGAARDLAVREWSALAPGADATKALGRALGERAPDGAVILLEGALGAGKTTLAQGVAEGCGVSEPVTSPTYNLVLHYRGRRPFTHVDLYRLATRDDLATLDLDEIAGSEGVTCVEWAALVRAEVAPPYAEVRLAIDPAPGAPGRRRIDGRLVGEGWDPASDGLEAAGAQVAPAGPPRAVSPAP